MKQVWIDCDGVLADFIGAYLALVKQHTGRDHAVTDVTAFELHQCVTSKDEDNFIWRNLIDQPGWIAGMVDLPGAAEAVAELRTIAKVGVLTSPHLGPYWMHERAQWLLARGFKKRDIIFASDKSHVRGDVLIDDRKDNCIDWAKSNPGGLAILLDAPWNQGSAPHCLRALNWNEAVRLTRNALAAMVWPNQLPAVVAGQGVP
jgi:5'(3')-deoxyribonucleotidase